MLRQSIPLLLLALAWPAARAQDTLAARALDFDVIGAPAGWQPVAPDRLDDMRGGFITPEGLALSLGIERMVSINGQVVAHTTFQIADARNISGAEARRAHAALISGTLVQNGAGNFALGDTFATARGTVVQNSLDGQAIRTHTIISSSVNSMSLMKAMNFQAGLRDAGIRAIGTH